MSTQKTNKSALAEILKDLSKPRGDFKKAGFTYSIHDKQKEALASLFRDKKNTVFVPCGRKFGKTHTACYALYRYALTRPNSACYYIAPEKTHARELIWKNNRLQKFLEKDGAKYIQKIQDREMTIRFKNGSFITLLGSDNWMAANGLTPDFVVYDEFKGFKSQFHIEMAPNLIAKNAPLLIIGTQPKVGDANKDQYEQELEAAKENPETSAVHVYTTFDNPLQMLPDYHKRTMQEIKKLRDSGQEDVVQREYYSKIVPGGSNAIFPTFNEEIHTMGPIELNRRLRSEAKDLRWVVGCDPATSSTFAVVLMAVNKVTKEVYLVDEIYEKDQSELSPSRMWPRIQSMVNKHTLGDRHRVQYVSDEREGLFINEVRDQFRQHISPTQKHLHKKHNGITLIRDLFLFEMIVISKECTNTVKEITEYARDSKGNVPKKNDHAIDCISKGELVSTLRGDIPIEDVKVGDRVYTNLGVDIVTDHWSKGTSKIYRLTFSDGSTIKCTKDHKIYTKNRGFVQSYKLTEYDTFDTINIWEKKKLHIKALFSDVTQTLKTSLIENILGHIAVTIKKVLGIFTGMFTSVKKDLYQKAIKFITGITTRLITQLKTLCLWRQGNIFLTMLKSFIGKTLSLLGKILKKTKISVGLGILVKKVKSGIQRIQKSNGKICQKLKKSVFYVDRNIWFIRICRAGLNTVTPTVRLLEIEELGREKVYDLTTRNYSRFYVNGKLVHNCMRYALGHINYTVVQPNLKPDMVKVLPNDIYVEREKAQSSIEMENTLDIDSSMDFWDY